MSSENVMYIWLVILSLIIIIILIVYSIKISCMEKIIGGSSDCFDKDVFDRKVRESITSIDAYNDLNEYMLNSSDNTCKEYLKTIFKVQVPPLLQDIIRQMVKHQSDENIDILNRYYNRYYLTLNPIDKLYLDYLRDLKYEPKLTNDMKARIDSMIDIDELNSLYYSSNPLYTQYLDDKGYKPHLSKSEIERINTLDVNELSALYFSKNPLYREYLKSKQFIPKLGETKLEDKPDQYKEYFDSQMKQAMNEF